LTVRGIGTFPSAIGDTQPERQRSGRADQPWCRSSGLRRKDGTEAAVVKAEEDFMDRLIDQMVLVKKKMGKEDGAMGYILLWAMGVPASLLFLIFLMRGCT
jgi:hypothetical protein